MNHKPIHSELHPTVFEGADKETAIKISNSRQLSLLEELRRLRPYWNFRNSEDKAPLQNISGKQTRLYDISCSSKTTGHFFIELKDFSSLIKWEATGQKQRYWDWYYDFCTDPSRLIVLFIDEIQLFEARSEMFGMDINEVVAKTQFSKIVNKKLVREYYGQSLLHLMENARCVNLEQSVPSTLNGRKEKQYIFSKSEMLGLKDLLDEIEKGRIFPLHCGVPSPKQVYNQPVFNSDSKATVSQSLNDMFDLLMKST